MSGQQPHPAVQFDRPLNQLRRDLRRARRALSPRQQRAHAAAAVSLLCRSPWFRGARRIALYWPGDGELDPLSLLAQAAGQRRRWYLPVLRPHARGRLWFARYRADDRLRLNRYGIPEPTRRGRHLRGPQAMDLILMPLVGFDADCNRIGMGAGYYDRSLGFLPHRRHWRRPLLIGLAHECQRVEQLEPRPWDIPLDAVVTETRLHVQSSRRQ
ncbi:5-formyltetrahydrofolate cyclo-ligase [Thiohalocapsa marina]|uniref:5-formyltetrahydrofolate cyclo-ligase n=1 Tax=Thiohalocapsa marina TaxID=424902 RepID=A0A5M8FUF5_9GAMM|nr:5-formyltetrahydrofolate cyclo-ligase [Thiohalocapsa marina]KAA6187437.1 5-formyltetrahydrofolate cyclo-ligase [Thiohalocapsa marina]